MTKNMINFIVVCAILYATLVVVMTVFQRKLLYHPDKHIGAAEQYGLVGFSEYFVKTADGISVQMWYKPAKAGEKTIIYYHGNASHIGNRAGIYSALAGEGFGVLALSYRGYGKSDGEPSEQGIYSDARSAINFLTETQKIPLDKIILYGESLGSGVAVQMASEQKFAALVLQAPYTSVTNRAAEIYWFLPVRLMLRDHFESLNKISLVKSPVLIFHGELDATIPIEHGKQLLAAANEPKQAVFFADVEHNNFDSGVIADHVREFVGGQ